MRRNLAAVATVAGVLLTACGGGSGGHASGTTTTTDATAYTTAYTVCLQFDNTDAARNAEPQRMTDDAADAVFAGLALQLKSASAKDPAWRKLQTQADLLRKQLMGTTASDDAIESTITKMSDACAPARKKPKSLSPQPTSTTSTTSAGA